MTTQPPPGEAGDGILVCDCVGRRGLMSREPSRCYSPLTTAPFWIWEGDILKIKGCLKSESLKDWIECLEDWIVSDGEEKVFGWRRRSYLYWRSSALLRQSM
jgi:hypothetical protein